MLSSDLGGLANLLATIRQQYPQANVTSGYRGPNNPLTREHPRSFHAQGSPEDPGAVDVAPIPGVNFDDYVRSIKGAGVPIREAFDEQKHPFSWTTGPNWHLAQGQSVAQPIRKPRTLGDVSPSPSQAPWPDFRKGWEFNPVMSVADQQAPMRSLGDVLPSPNLPTPGHKGLFPGKDLASILGILGDAMTAYGGGQPTFGPAMYQKRRDEQQQGFDREKLAAMMEAQRSKANEPPQFVQNAMAWAQMGPDQRRMVLEQQDAVNPINVSTPQGTQNVPRLQHKTVGGKNYYAINGEWYEEGE